jgi:hypothetical protein
MQSIGNVSVSNVRGSLDDANGMETGRVGLAVDLCGAGPQAGVTRVVDTDNAIVARPVFLFLCIRTDSYKSTRAASHYILLRSCRTGRITGRKRAGKSYRDGNREGGISGRSLRCRSTGWSHPGFVHQNRFLQINPCSLPLYFASFLQNG